MSSEANIHVNTRITLNMCANQYGVAPCTANLTPGFQCVNTFGTCQDKPNYVPTEGRLNLCSNSMVSWEDDPGILERAYPCIIEHPRHTSTEIKRGEGVAVRGGCDIICTDFAGPAIPTDTSRDPYVSDRADPGQGTFWGKFKDAHRYYDGAKVEIIHYQVFPEGTRIRVSDYEYRLARIDGPDENGRVRLRCRDILAAIDDDSAVVPDADAASLVASINPTATSFEIQGYNPNTWAPSNGYFVIEEEACSYTTFNSGTGILSGVVRGLGGTNNVSHDAGEAVSYAKLWSTVNAVDVIYELLTTYAGIDPAYIPYTTGVDPTAQWDAEKDTYLSGHNLTRILFEPNGVGALLDEICRECYLNLWYDPDLKQILLSATNTSLASQTALPFNEERMLTASQELKEVPNRITP